MSKFIFVKFKEKQDNIRITDDLQSICDRISPESIRMKHRVLENQSCANSFTAIQNAIEQLDDVDHLLLGHVNADIQHFNKVGDPLPDGSYSLIRYNEDYVEFFCDKFSSRTMWYYFDKNKIIISNSQKAIVALKKEFKLNKATVSWFMSSGSQGPFLSWDMDIKMVSPLKLVRLDIAQWIVKTSLTEYLYETENKSLDAQDFEGFYKNYTREALKVITSEFNLRNLILPLSGGYDSRLLFYIMRQIPRLSEIKTINWGKKENDDYDDKKAAKIIAQHYKLNHIDYNLPDSLQNFKIFLEKFINLGDCRIDHFNAFTDNFQLWNDLYYDDIKIIIRGDIPFPTGLNINNVMARTRIGINLFTDYENIHDYDLGTMVTLQDTIEGINREEGESLIQWRDRLYTTYRMSIVTSAFSDLINSYIENRSPMISGELFYYYSNLPDKFKGNKKHIVSLSKKLDTSLVSFKAAPSIPSQQGLFKNKDGIRFLKSYLQNITDDGVLTKSLIESVLLKLNSVTLNEKGLKRKKETLKSFLSANLPVFLKTFLKSKVKLHLDPVTLSYRIVMIDLAIKMYNNDASFLNKNHDN